MLLFCPLGSVPHRRQRLGQEVHQHRHPVRDVAVAGQHGVNAQGRWGEIGQDLHHLARLQKRRCQKIGLYLNAHACRIGVQKGQAIVGR